MTPRPALELLPELGAAATMTAESALGGHIPGGGVVNAVEGGAGVPRTTSPPSKLSPEDHGTDDPDEIVDCCDGGHPSLDEMIKSRFEECRKAGSVLRTDPLETSVIRRRLPGPLGLVAKYQPGLLSNKRSTSLPPKVSVDEPYDGTKFNFNRVPESEVLVRIDCDGHRHPILANVSPLMYGHSLLIPLPQECIPQRLTPGAVDVALELLGRSSGSFRIGFNSLGGFSSVNHLHLHVLYPGEVMAALPDGEHDGGAGELIGGRCGFPIESAPAKRTVACPENCDGCFRVDLLDWMVPCFSFLATSSGSPARAVEAMRDGVVRFLSILRDRGIPHNVLFVPAGRGRAGEAARGGGDGGIRIIVIPRKPQHHFDPEKAGYNAALGEICGYLVAKSRDHYDGFIEEDIVGRMGESVACEPGVLHSLLTELAKMMCDGGGGDDELWR